MNSLCEDKFNSEIFRMNMGNLIIDDLSEINSILIQAKKQGYDHLSAKINTNDLITCNLLLQKGFKIVDTLVSYQYDYEKTPLLQYHYNQDVIIKPVESCDIDELSRIAHDSFFNDRFHNDPSLKNELCDLYYEKWIYNSCHGFADLVLVGKDKENNILGFGTGKIVSDKESALVLNAVTEYARGKGVYTAMIWEAMNYFKDRTRYLTLGTQINNYAVQKAWSKLGFKIFDSKYVLHKIII